MKKVFTCLVTVALTVSLSFSAFIVPSFAVDPVTVAAVSKAVSEFLSAYKVAVETREKIANAVDFEFPPADQVGARNLVLIVNEYNNGDWFRRFLASYPDFLETVKGAGAYFDGAVPASLACYIERDVRTNIARPAIRKGFGLYEWLVDKNGHYPYCSWDDYVAFRDGGTEGIIPAQDPIWNPYRNKWVNSEDVNFSSGVITTKDALASALLELGRGELWAVQLGRGKYYVLYDKINDDFWCNNNNQCWILD